MRLDMDTVEDMVIIHDYNGASFLKIDKNMKLASKTLIALFQVRIRVHTSCYLHFDRIITLNSLQRNFSFTFPGSLKQYAPFDSRNVFMYL